MFNKIKTRSKFVPKMIKFLIKKEIVRTEREALLIILSASVASMCISAFLINESVITRPAVIDSNLISSK